MYLNTTAFTVKDVSKMLEGIDWERLCHILDISVRKRKELTASFASDEERREGTIQWWITADPLASWRRVVDQLYRWWGVTDEELAIGDRLRHYCEGLTGTYYSTSFVIMCVCLIIIVAYEALKEGSMHV